jgi:hypothetical protein
MIDVAARIAAIVLAAILALGVVFCGNYIGTVYVDYVECKASGENLGVRTIYRPWSGCQYVLFDLKVST